MKNEFQKQIKVYSEDLKKLSDLVLNNQNYKYAVLSNLLGSELKSYQNYIGESTNFSSIEEEMPMLLELYMAKIVNGAIDESVCDPDLFNQLMQFIEKHELSGETKRR